MRPFVGDASPDGTPEAPGGVLPGASLAQRPGRGCRLWQCHRSQPVVELNENVLLAFVDPARHPVPRLAGDIHGAYLLARSLIDREKLPGVVSVLPAVH